MGIRERIKNEFGENALDFGLFFKYKAGLRFELSEGDSYIEMFISAYKKAEKILESAFKGSKKITVCLAYYGEDTILDNLSSLKGLEDCQIKIKNNESWEQYRKEDESQRIFVAFETDKKELIKILWAVLATELGIKPQIGCDPYFIDFKNRILAHPYDDRGMDIIGNNKQRLQELYRKYNKYLLKCNVDEMKKHYQ